MVTVAVVMAEVAAAVEEMGRILAEGATVKVAVVVMEWHNKAEEAMAGAAEEEWWCNREIAMVEDRSEDYANNQNRKYWCASLVDRLRRPSHRTKKREEKD